MPDFVSKNMRLYRDSAGLTQSEVAEKLGTTQNQISRYESGARVPDVYFIIQYARAVGCPTEVLLRGSIVPVHD